MDVHNKPPSPGSAVSGLMQQLKSGEISKMQLFQQIAKLQAASRSASSLSMNSGLPPPPPAMASPSTHLVTAHARTVAQPPQPVSSSAASTIFRGSAPLSSATIQQSSSTVPFVSFNYSPPRQPANQSTTAYLQSKPMAAAVVSQSNSVMPPQQFAGGFGATPLSMPAAALRLGAQPVASDAEILSSGVSHDQVQRLSVQEWIASKTRPAAAATVPPSNIVTLGTSPSIHAAAAPSPSLFSFLGQSQPQPQPQQYNEYASVAPTDQRAGMVSDAPYVYTPQWEQAPPLGTSTDHQDARYEDHDGHTYGGGSGGTEYLRFDPFCDDSHGANDGPTNNSGKNNNGRQRGGRGGGREGDEAKFHTRVTRWKSQKDAVREQMKQQLLQSELDECTFAPKVNPTSTKVVAKLRGRQRSIGGGDSDSGGGEGGGGMAVSERLYQEADNYKVREELAARLKAEEEAELQRECTFQPRINKNNHLTEKVKPKYMDIPKRDAPVITPAAMEAAAKELEQCTFMPQVNAISHEMVSAQLYLQQNIYERLSRPCVSTGDHAGGGDGGDGDGSVGGDYGDDTVGMARFHTQDDLYVRSRSRRRGSNATTSLGHRAWSSTNRPRSAGGIATDEEKAERAKQFEEFLERQKFHEQARKKKIEVTQQQLVAPHRPSINKNSQMMMENGHKGDFLERITKYAIRKEHDTVKNKTVRVSDPNCTFKPTINAHSAKRNARSVTELSRGDLLRRETTQRLMKLKMEQEEMASLTFRPQLSRASQRVEGRLKILTSPDTYLERIQQQSQAHIIKQRRAVQEKEMEEFSECTFKPRTIEAPAYVQRIARSVVLTKALKKQQEATAKASQKPEWK